MNAKSKIVKFNNQQVPVFIQGDKPYVLMKPICENIGLDWNSQKKRINRNAVLSKGKVMMTSPSNGFLNGVCRHEHFFLLTRQNPKFLNGVCRHEQDLVFVPSMHIFLNGVCRHELDKKEATY